MPDPTLNVALEPEQWATVLDALGHYAKWHSNWQYANPNTSPALQHKAESAQKQANSILPLIRTQLRD